MGPVVHRLVSHVPAQHAALGAVHTLPLNPEGHGHSHGPGPSVPGEHGQGSLEHGKALFAAAAPMPSLVLVLLAVATVVPQPPSSPSLPAWHRVEKSQGP